MVNAAVYFIFMDIIIYLKCNVYIENKEMYNNLLLKTNFCF